MNCGRIDLTVDNRDLPGAAAGPAEAPVAATKGGVSELAVAAAARAYAGREFDQGVRSIEHAFAMVTGAPLARLFDHAQIDKVSRLDPPAQIGWASSDMNAAGSCLDGSDLLYLRASTFSRARVG